MCRFGLGRLCLSAVVALSLSSPAFGQAITGVLVGTIRDPSGGIIVNAKITVTNQNTGISSSRLSDTQGNFVAPYLAPGTYKVTAEFPGFRMGVSEDNVVLVNQTTRVDFELTPGAVTEQVQVTAAAPLVQSTTSEVGHVVEDQQIESLPLNGRLFEQLITLTPGTVPTGFADFGENPAAAGARSPIHASVNGLPWSGNHFTMDGVNNSEPLNAFINVTPPLDAIQEFKVQTNNPSAEYGSFGGAIVNLTMKSGTNAYHGSLFEYVRNDILNARDFFAPTRAPFKTNQFGGTIGGPIKRNTLFFFGDYQGMRQRSGRAQVITVPTPLQRQGILTEGNQPPFYDPLTGQVFAGNVIPPSRMNPISRQVADIWPLPNRPGLADNYVENNSLAATVNQFDIKGDWQITERDSFFARESMAMRDLTDPSPGNVFMAPGPGGSGFNSDSRNQNAVAGYTRIFSPTKINELRIGFNRYAVTHFAPDFGIPKNNELGIPNGNVPGHEYTFGIARFSIPGFQQTGGPGSTNAIRVANIFQYTDNFTWIRSRHTLKFGGDIRRVQSTLTNPQTAPRGLFEFDRNVTSNQGAAGTGNAWASFLLGYPWHVARDFVDTRPGVRMLFTGFYAQDDFRVTNSMTLNLGLRWDLFTRPVEKYNRQSNFNPSTGLIDIASKDNRGPNVDNYLRNWGPRFGFAWSPDNGKTALRGAYGISYFPDNFGATGGTLERNYPFFLLTEFFTPEPLVPFRSVSDGLPGFERVPLQPQLTPPPGFAVFVVSQNFRQDMAQMWNFSLQRQVTRSLMAEAAYVATKGSHIYRNRNINVPFPGPGPLAQRRPFFAIAPTISVINQRNGDGDSNYQSAQFKVVQRYSAGLTMLVSYTISKSIDDYTNIFFPLDDKLNRGLSSDKAIDVPQTLVISYSYELPWGRGKKWLSGISRPVDALVGGWSINGITSFRSGAPLAVRVGTSRLNTGTTNRADITCSSVPKPKRVEQWFDTSCFADPAPFAFGNSGIGHVRGPGLHNWDFSIFKQFSVTERSRFEFRGEFFNLFNMPHFRINNNTDNTTLGTSSFGRISSTALPGREIQLGAKFSF
ncbi:MAG TPA: TonB-dependent receptor [Bryobacteraceae bacterium]|nr:TonB-dependent receptor [Bryobacteraceae bacterium]